MIKERVITFILVCLILGIVTNQLPTPVDASTSPSIIDVGITAKTTLPPETFLRARPGDRFVAWSDISYSGPMLTIQIRTTIIDPNGNELNDPLGDPFLVLLEDMPGHTGWTGDDFEIPGTAILGTYDVKFSILSQDGTQVYDSVIKSGWLELFSGDEPDIRTFTGPIDFSSVVVGTEKIGGKPIWNDGTATLAINSIQRTSGSTDFAYVEPATPFEVSAGNAQYITIRFTPSSEGNKSAIFIINSNDPDEANITLSVSGSGITQTGTIEVTSDPSGFPFELTGPMDYSCPTPWLYESAPLGTYTITWPPMSGYQAPPPETKTLMQGETITFHGDYSLIQETISTPDTPSGPTSGTVGTSYTYTTGGSSSSLAHEVEYLFDWGDGYYSGWSPEISASHAWTNPGTYTIKALARSGTHTDVLSSWSSGLTVSIDPVSLATIDCYPSSFSFSAVLGEGNPPNQMLSIKNSGGGNLNWSISRDTDWLNLSPSSGISTGEADIVVVSVSTFEIDVGSYSATITITAPDATNTPLTIPVNLTIEQLQVGNINVTSNPSGASFTLSGPTNYNGITPWSKPDAPAGSYTITWESIMGYTTPSSEKKTLTQGNIISFSGSYQSTLILGRDIPQKSPGFFNDVLNSLGILPNSLAVEAFKTWTQFENTNAYWNPLATTRDMGEESWNYNDAGVKNYIDKETGIQATAETLRLYYYEAIRKMLAQESFDEQALRRALGTWSGLSADTSYVINLVSEWRDIFQFPLKTTINVTSDPSGASFTLSGPADYRGTTPWSQADAPVGTYTVTWGFMSGYQTPTQEIKILTQGGMISFDGQYAADEPFLGANAITLWEYYTAWGKDLPPVSERAKIYEALGLGSTSEYTGTAEQNTRLLNALKERQICPLTGEEVGWVAPQSTLADLIQEQATGGIPVTIDDELYIILTLKNRIDPITLEVMPNSGATKVYVYGDRNDPVSEKEIAQKIGRVEEAQRLQKTYGSPKEIEKASLNLIERWGAHEKLEHWSLARESLVQAPSLFIRGYLSGGTLALKDLAEFAKQEMQVLVESVADPKQLIYAIIYQDFEDAAQEYYEALKIASRGEITDSSDALSYLEHLFNADLYYSGPAFTILADLDEIQRTISGEVRAFVADVIVDTAFDLLNTLTSYNGNLEMIQTAQHLQSIDDLKRVYDVIEVLEEMKQIQSISEYMSAKSNGSNQVKNVLHHLHTNAAYTLELANNPRITAEVHSPVELRVYDSEQRVTGLVNGEEKTEIPYSVYQDNSVTIFSPTEAYRYEIFGRDEGKYDLEVSKIGDEPDSYVIEQISTATKTIHQYSIDWKALADNKKGVTLQIDSDGDGTFEEIKKLGKAGTVPIWVWIALAGLCGIVGVFIGALIVRRRMGGKQTTWSQGNFK